MIIPWLHTCILVITAVAVIGFEIQVVVVENGERDAIAIYNISTEHRTRADAGDFSHLVDHIVMVAAAHRHGAICCSADGGKQNQQAAFPASQNSLAALSIQVKLRPMLRPAHTLLILLSLTAMHCVKKQFIAFEKPHSVMHIRQNSSTEILQEPLKQEMIMWDSGKLAEIPVEGLLRVTYKKTDYFYLQMNCPAQLKCNGKKVYIPRNLTHAPEADSLPFKSEYKEPPVDASAARFVLAESPQIKELIATRNWLGDSSRKDIPTRFDLVVFRASLPPQNQIAAYGNLAFLARSVTQNEYPEKPLANYVSNFPIYADIVKSKGANLSEAQKTFLRDLYKGIEADYTKLLRKEIEEFPFENPSYAAMAAALNRIDAPQMLKAELVNKIAANTAFIVKEPAALTPVVAPGGAALYAQEATPPAADAKPVKIHTSTSLTSGVIFEYEKDGKTIRTPVQETDIVAFAHEKGVGFQLGRDKAQATILEPMEESLYLRSGNKAEIDKFVRGIPKPEEIIHEFDFDLALLRMAMKTGKGELSRQSGLFEYEIDLARGRNFWDVLALVKNFYGVNNEDTYAGEIPDNLTPYGASDRSKGSINWYQKYDKATKIASLGIKGNATYCQRRCETISVDTVCMTNQDILKITFRPAALNEKNVGKDNYHWRSPNVHADFVPRKNDSTGGGCNEFLRMALTAEKFE